MMKAQPLSGMVAQISTGTLCTLAVEPEGYPSSWPPFTAEPNRPDQRTRRAHQELGGILARRCWCSREALQIRSLRLRHDPSSLRIRTRTT